jgi:hypothetical protein
MSWKPWEARDSTGLHVLNMYAENFGRIVKQKLWLPIVQVKRVGEQHCLIVDERVPRAWFLEEPCPSCTPPSVMAELRSSQVARYFRRSHEE